MYSDRSGHNSWVLVVQLDNCGVFCINSWCADTYLMAPSDQQCWPMSNKGWGMQICLQQEEIHSSATNILWCTPVQFDNCDAVAAGVSRDILAATICASLKID